MKKVLQVTRPHVYAAYLGAPELHPLISVIHFDELSSIRNSLNHYGVYGLFIQKTYPKNLSYGMRTFDAPDASIVAVAPGQTGGGEDDGTQISLSGWALLWSPELLHGTELEARMPDYRYFSYFATETLRTRPAEWDRITLLISLLREELRENADSPSLRTVVLGYLRLILEYCNRIWLRQLSREDRDSPDLLKRFHQLLVEYYCDNRQLEEGIPSVSFCASQLAYSPRYFGDMIHRATGGTAIGYIHSFVLQQGKSLLVSGHNVNETARLLGFDYAHHFSRFFKRMTGKTPSEFLAD